MIYIYYTYIYREWPDAFTQHMMRDFSEDEKSRLNNVAHWKVRQAKIAGRKLIAHGLDALNVPDDKRTLLYNACQKPFLKSGPYFNISHSGNCVVCVISEAVEVGIDIEHKTRRSPDVLSVFTENEKEIIGDCPDTLFKMWTKKEAIVKADGRGFQQKLKNVDASKEFVDVNGKKYAAMEVEIDREYACCVAYQINSSDDLRFTKDQLMEIMNVKL